MDTPQESKKPFWKSKGFLYVIGILFALGLIQSAVDSSKEKVNTPTPVVETPVEKPAEIAPVAKNDAKAKADAQTELDALMQLSKQAQLVTSYEFSDKATVVYADKGWYTQTVIFKKDFLAKIASLKNTITGYRHFEVLDAYTNEKVAEVASFSGSLEVYK